MPLKSSRSMSGRRYVATRASSPRSIASGSSVCGGAQATRETARDASQPRPVLGRPPEALAAVDRALAKKAVDYGPELMRMAEKSLLLQILDQCWKDHLLQLAQIS